MLADKLGTLLHQPFVIDNRPGAGGMIGQAACAKASPDGYTLLLAGGTMAGARFVNANMAYDIGRDFTPISLLEVSPFVLVASPALPARNISELIAYARGRKSGATFGTTGAGQTPYWAAVLFNKMAEIDAIEVPYKGSTDSVIDLISGRLDYSFVAMAVALANKDKLKILGVSSKDRSETMPDVPTVAEGGLPGYELPSWRSVMGPAGMAADVVDLLNRAIVQALGSADLREKFLHVGSVPFSSTPEGLRRRYEEWAVIFGKIAKDAGLKPQ